MDEAWPADVVRELARVLPLGPAVRTVLYAAGFPPELLPSLSDTTPLDFWSEINTKLSSGVIEDGHDRVLAAAADRFPTNRILRGWAIRTVLFVGASPVDRLHIRSDRELREILTATARLGIKVDYCPAADVTDLQKLRSLRPDLLHLSCHGENGNLVFEHPSGRHHAVPADDVASLLETYRAHAGVRLQGVLLGSCFGETIAAAFAQLMTTVVAHRGQLDDDCAAKFAGEFYSVLADVREIGAAATIAAKHVSGYHRCASLQSGLIVLEPPHQEP